MNNFMSVKFEILLAYVILKSKNHRQFNDRTLDESNKEEKCKKKIH